MQILKKTQVTAFHLRNKEANRSLKVVWNETELGNTAYPKYLGVTLDRSLCYKQHIQNAKMKVTTRNTLLTKWATSKWGANPSTIRMTAFALSYSTAQYAIPVWARSPHAKNLDPGQNQACRSVTGYLKPTNVTKLTISIDRNNQPERPTLCLVRFYLPNALSLDTVSCQVYNPYTSQQKLLDDIKSRRNTKSENL